VADLLDRLEPLAEQLRGDKELEIVWDCPSPLPVMETDGLRLEQILTNLVTNAVKFTQKGQITVRARQVLGQDLVIFEISDSGIGIPAEELRYIFDEFRQVDGSISRRYGGMGLGLALVKKLVTLLHGEISVISQVGQGSTFTVTFPLRLPSSAKIAEAPSPPQPQEVPLRAMNKAAEMEKRVA
jgi:signal transduction histidine kinase